MDQTIVIRLKEQFRDFCGLLSVTEIASNPPLMRVLERFERMLNEVSSNKILRKEEKK